MTSKRVSSTHHTMMSSRTPPSSFSSWVYCARPGATFDRSLHRASCRVERASGPPDAHGAEVAHVEDDGVAAAREVLGDRPGAGTASGISNPPNSTSFAPSAAWTSCSAVRRSAVVTTIADYAAVASSPSSPWRSSSVTRSRW